MCLSVSIVDDRHELTIRKQTRRPSNKGTLEDSSFKQGFPRRHIVITWVRKVHMEQRSFYTQTYPFVRKVKKVDKRPSD